MSSIIQNPRNRFFLSSMFDMSVVSIMVFSSSIKNCGVQFKIKNRYTPNVILADARTQQNIDF